MNILGIKKTTLLSSFNEDGHWYTSYPSLNHWREDFGGERYKDHLENLLLSDAPLHLYIHIPFCPKLCFYCICNISITSDQEKIDYFLDHLLKEVENFKLRYGKANIQEIHLGGGTPSHLGRRGVDRLLRSLRDITKGEGWSECAMEVDPRVVSRDDLRFFSSQGVTRLSFGIQDFDGRVQEAINRIQPYEMVKEVLEERHLFTGVNFDLLYGLPKQSLQTLEETVTKTLTLSPERITLLKYCHAPEVRRHMKLIKVEDLATDTATMFVDTTQRLMDNGYKWVGLDHFSKPTDSLSGKVVRTFNGFKAAPVKDMICFGPTATSAFNDVYAQAHYDLNLYYQDVNLGRHPILRGYKLTPEDLMRRKVIFDLLCDQRAVIPEEMDAEVKQLYKYPELCHYRDGELTIHPYGRILMRKILKVFDNRDVKPEHMKIAQRTITRKPIESPARQSA